MCKQKLVASENKQTEPPKTNKNAFEPDKKEEEQMATKQGVQPPSAPAPTQNTRFLSRFFTKK